MAMIKEPTPTEIENQQIYHSMGMTAEEFEKVKTILGRLPNYTELGLFSVMWSEHCSYKNSKVLLKKFPTEGERVLQGPGEGAGIVDIGDNLGVVFKMESHNHPSAVEPFEGAATGVGGIVRDVFSMGARPVALLNSLRFGELENDRVKFLLREAVAGMAFYGNGVGVPTVGGEIYFDDCYEGNPLVNAMCVGIIGHQDIKKGQAHGAGNIVIYAGAETGRDGVHGATFASEELSDEEADRKSSSIPAGNPAMEKLLIEACLEVMQNPALVGIQDMGAAGLISSSSEMASKAGMGIELNLDHVPKRESDITAYEMMLSESQERMLMVVKKGHEQEFIDIFKKHGVQAVAVGHVTTDKLVRILHRGEIAAEVPADALASQAPVYHRPSKEPKRDLSEAVVKPIADYNKTLLDLLAQPTIASKEWVYQQFDPQASPGVEACADVAVSPGSDSGVIRIKGTNKAVAMTADCNSRYVYLDPYTGGQIAIAEAARNIIASGGMPLAATDCLNYGSPENPEVFWQMEQSVEGISEACRVLNTPVISGNVSLYNERSSTGAIYPTPTIGMVGLIADIDHITTQDFKTSGDLIYIVGETKPEFGGSELQKLQYGKISGMPPSIDMASEKTNQDLVLVAITEGLVQSAHDISEGGIAVALAESLMTAKSPTGAKGLGAEIHVDMNNDCLFSESQSRFIVTVAAEHEKAFGELLKTFNNLVAARPGEGSVSVQKVGQVTDTGRIIIGTAIDLSVEECSEQWKGAIPCLLK